MFFMVTLKLLRIDILAKFLSKNAKATLPFSLETDACVVRGFQKISEWIFFYNNGTY